MAWLETLVWPGQEHRVHHLRAAIEIARADPPKIHQGNLLSALPAIASMAPSDAQLIIFHTAVLAYVPSQADRNSFAAAVRRTGATWISNEAPSVFPEFARYAPPSPSPGHFLLSINGKPVAWLAGPGGCRHLSISWWANGTVRALYSPVTPSTSMLLSIRRNRRLPRSSRRSSSGSNAPRNGLQVFNSPASPGPRLACRWSA